MDAEIVVIGAGVIGLAVANKMAEKGYSTILLEKEAKYGLHSSSRNSEVIHAGVYYKTGSHKSKLCLKGKHLLYEYCKKNSIRHAKIGKLFIAVSYDEIYRLEETLKQGQNNGLDDLCILDYKNSKKIEPEIKCVASLSSPSTGIIDSYSFMEHLFVSGQNNGVIFAGNSPVIDAEPIKNGWEIQIGGSEPVTITSRGVVNASGLYAVQLSKHIFPQREIPTLYPSKGCYLKYLRKSPINHIIYPGIIPGVIEERVDATPGLDGYLRFGPNSEETSDIQDYSLSPLLVKKMLSGINRYLPNIDESHLHLDLAGIRPRIYRPGDNVEDFRFDWASDPGWLDLWGIESPGLTSSLAIAEYVHFLFFEKSFLQ